MSTKYYINCWKEFKCKIGFSSSHNYKNNQLICHCNPHLKTCDNSKKCCYLCNRKQCYIKLMSGDTSVEKLKIISKLAILKRDNKK